MTDVVERIARAIDPLAYEGEFAEKCPEFAAMFRDKNRNQAERMLKALQPGDTFNGMVVAPVSPDKQMIDAGETALEDQTEVSTCSRTGHDYQFYMPGHVAAVYSAMLASLQNKDSDA